MNKISKNIMITHLQLIIQMLDLHPIGLRELDFLEVTQQLTVWFAALPCDLILEFEELIAEHHIDNLIGSCQQWPD